MLLTMLYAVYVDTVDEKRIVAIPAFRSLLETATTREGSDIVLVHDDEEDERNGGMEPQKPGEGQSILCTKAESGVGGVSQYQPVLL